MSEQEKQGSGGINESSAVIMVEQTESHVKPSYRPTDLKNDSEVLHKRSRAPAVPVASTHQRSSLDMANLSQQAVAEELKTEDTSINQMRDSKEVKEIERTISSEKKYTVPKKASKRRDASPEIPLAPLANESKKDISSKSVQSKHLPTPTQPIPPQIKEGKSEASVIPLSKEDAERRVEEDSITEDVTDLRTSEETKKHSEWSDDEEAGGLPRSESRASRVSRAVRQLLCCGLRYEAASEDNISTRSGCNTGI